MKGLPSGIPLRDMGANRTLARRSVRFHSDEIVIQTKTGAKDYDGANTSITRSLQEMQTDYLDVLLLHGISSPEDLVSREGALDAFREAKAAGKIRVIGCSTHHLHGSRYGCRDRSS